MNKNSKFKLTQCENDFTILLLIGRSIVPGVSLFPAAIKFLYAKEKAKFLLNYWFYFIFGFLSISVFVCVFFAGESTRQHVHRTKLDVISSRKQASPSNQFLYERRFIWGEMVSSCIHPLIDFTSLLSQLVSH